MKRFKLWHSERKIYIDMRKGLILTAIILLIVSCREEGTIYEFETSKNNNDMALPLTGVSVSLVRSTLGASTNDVGLLCTHPNINRWSKWKPIRSNKLDGITESDIISAKSGLVVPSVSGYANIVSYYRNNPGFTFPYNKPRGGAYNEYYRLGDFRNYDKDAEIFYDVVVPGYIFTSLVNIRLYTYLPDVPGSDLERWINWDFLGLGDLYFGVILTLKNSNTPIAVYFSEDPVSGIDDLLIQHYLTPVPSAQTDYEVFAFIGENPGEDDPGNYTFYILEDGHKEMQFRLQMVITGSAEYMGGGVEYVIDIANNTDTNISMTGVDLVFRYDDNGTDDELEPIEPFETIVNVGNITITPSGYNLGDFISGILPQLPTRGGYLYFRSTSHPHLNKVIDIAYS